MNYIVLVLKKCILALALQIHFLLKQLKVLR